MYEPLDLAKTHEILARFRPIAPKPHLPHAPPPSPPLPLRSRRCKRARAHLPAKRRKTAAFFPFLTASQPLVERDLLQNLQKPNVIAPRPVRPVGSSISVGFINELAQSPPPPPHPLKKVEEVEEEVESERLPTVVSDYKNRVRMANSAYKEMVGQPECVWLDSVVFYGSDFKGFGLRPLSRRINGEVALEFSGGSAGPPPSLNGFSCAVKIEWACNGRKTLIDAPCDVVRVCCESKEYLFAWKFHIGEGYM